MLWPRPMGKSATGLSTERTSMGVRPRGSDMLVVALIAFNASGCVAVMATGGFEQSRCSTSHLGQDFPDVLMQNKLTILPIPPIVFLIQHPACNLSVGAADQTARRSDVGLDRY